jgi:hypothetical protein
MEPEIPSSLDSYQAMAPKEEFNDAVFNLAIAQEELGRITIEKTTTESRSKEGGAARFYHP